ncbi:RidA family protein [Marinomonas sp. 15G1-11]|uniref:RidA family protein n=1 Tax=Marinomonas phaeophyticola TaxID=3004091 RepID=A0ABT4JVH0_9GAMM|nr:RidA family protein [Marinomonas sp. 15G1-11]MCZ2722216.1 RidA family protein [Marinomonas sp. 15G1-11]
MLSKASKIVISSLISLSPIFIGQANAESIEPVYTNGKISLPFSPAIKLNNGMLFLSGQIPYTKEGGIPDYAVDGVDDMADQTEIVMENLKKVLKTSGYSFNDVVKVSVFMSDIKNYNAFNDVYATYWGQDGLYPAREAIEVGALPGGEPSKEVLVEVSLIAFKEVN